VSDRSGVSRGDRNRNARLARPRETVPLGNAIAGIDLAGSKQMVVVVTDHESRVLARRTFRRRAWELGTALDWAAGRAAEAGCCRGLFRWRCGRNPQASVWCPV
jgi:transposase